MALTHAVGFVDDHHVQEGCPSFLTHRLLEQGVQRLDGVLAVQGPIL